MLVDEMFHIEPGVGMANDVSLTAALSLAAYLMDLVEERTRNPARRHDQRPGAG